jgi:hypothetical protein
MVKRPRVDQSASLLPRDQPMFFQGRQQTEEFARGAWAARDAMVAL